MCPRRVSLHTKLCTLNVASRPNSRSATMVAYTRLCLLLVLLATTTFARPQFTSITDFFFGQRATENKQINTVDINNDLEIRSVKVDGQNMQGLWKTLEVPKS
ncbi:hypothetical protein O3G_MSEX008871 [Manduca sexta]|uniref:Uncharacterized protein n=1 Tax=Manduca sexta TaxID=7130 RepID=A0A921ZB66_MANSE|nr:hypothetical protein O3G_MSEX008871 [Manduca sexta]